MYHEVGGLSPVNYKLSTGEGGVKKEKKKGMWLIEKRTLSTLCSLELNRRLSRQVMGEVSEKLLSSESLTDQNA